jgi:hypothetical protein
MGLFSRTKPAAPTASATGHTGGRPGARTPPNLDRQRLLAATVGNPRRFWEEANAARYDLETIQMCARTVQQDVGTSTLIALKGGHWTKEEIALQKAIPSVARTLTPESARPRSVSTMERSEAIRDWMTRSEIRRSIGGT